MICLGGVAGSHSSPTHRPAGAGLTAPAWPGQDAGMPPTEPPALKEFCARLSVMKITEYIF